MSSVGTENVVWEGGWAIGERAIGESGLKMGQLASSKGLARIGIRCHIQRTAIPSKGSFPFSYIINACMLWILYHVIHVCLIKKKNIPSVQVKNIPCDRESKHVFLFGSAVYMVVTAMKKKELRKILDLLGLTWPPIGIRPAWLSRSAPFWPGGTHANLEGTPQDTVKRLPQEI
jgi:hypothetical protein